MAMILMYCDIQTLVTVAAVCRSVRASALAELQHSLTVFLHRYFDHPDAVRGAMRSTGSVLSGSAALAWIDRSCQWSPRDLDFFCPYDLFFQFIDHLMRTMQVVDYTRYTITPNRHGKEYRFRRGVCERVTLASSKVKIDIYRSVTVSALYPLPFFHSTLLMNFVGADSFGVAYPSLTLTRRAVTHSRLLGSKDIRSVSKFCLRGYRFRESIFALRYGTDEVCKGRKNGCPVALRSFGDGGSLTVSWASHSQLDPLRWNVQWVMGGEPCGGYCVEYRSFWICLML